MSDISKKALIGSGIIGFAIGAILALFLPIHHMIGDCGNSHIVLNTVFKIIEQIMLCFLLGVILSAVGLAICTINTLYNKLSDHNIRDDLEITKEKHKITLEHLIYKIYHITVDKKWIIPCIGVIFSFCVAICFCMNSSKKICLVSATDYNSFVSFSILISLLFSLLIAVFSHLVYDKFSYNINNFFVKKDFDLINDELYKTNKEILFTENKSNIIELFKDSQYEVKVYDSLIICTTKDNNLIDIRIVSYYYEITDERIENIRTRYYGYSLKEVIDIALKA